MPSHPQKLGNEDILWILEMYPDTWCSTCLEWSRFVYAGTGENRYCTQCQKPVEVIKNGVVLGAMNIRKSAAKPRGEGDG